MRGYVESDASLRRVQRDSVVLGVAAAVLALVLDRGRPDGALGVVAGFGLMAFSYRAIRGGADALARRASDKAGTGVAIEGVTATGRPVAVTASLAWTVFRYITRYAVLAAAAWVVLIPLNASPVGLFVGVSVPVAAVGVEAVRLVRRAGARPPRGGETASL